MAGLIRQSVFIPSPELNEKTVPDQTGKVCIVTGGYTGVGLELSKILYGANARVYILGRSAEKGARAVEALKAAHPNSGGKAAFLECDLADLTSIKPAVQQFTAAESRLDLLTNNAGVMTPPKGSTTAQGFELQIGTNCLGPYLLTKLLRPTLAATAEKAPPASVRVTWAGSMAVDTVAPRGGGMRLDGETGEPAVLGVTISNYGQSKVGNVFLAVEGARRDTDSAGIVHVAFNPGNLKSELQRHLPGVGALVVRAMCYAPIYGAYTELWAGLSPDVTLDRSGAYVVPWGRFSGYRGDVEKAAKKKDDGGDGLSTLFWDWCDRTTAQYA